MVKGILVNRKSDEILKSTYKMDHADLIAEMQTVENLPTHERLQLARMRRAQQLKIARQKEKEWMKLQRAKGNGGGGGTLIINGSTTAAATAMGAQKQTLPGHRRHISFENSVVLLEAASRNDMQEVANLLQHGITPDAANEDGLTALHQCCIDNNVEMLKLLLDYGANVDAQDSDKWTPLHAAATCGHLNLVRILISCGANLLAVNTDGNMPYDLCDDENTLDFIEAQMSKRGVTQELIDETRSATEKHMLRDLMEVASNGGDLEEPDYQGATPLHIASANGYSRVVEFLLELHVNVDALDKDLWSPVHAAACWGHLEVLEMLAQFGADLNVKNKDDETPSDICEDPEIRERIEQLKSEQESKRLAEAQRRRVRRSQSNNTRAQSVRRTSLRDKTLTTKKDAVEEARLRLQAQEVFTAPDSTSELQSKAVSAAVIDGDCFVPSLSTTTATPSESAVMLSSKKDSDRVLLTNGHSWINGPNPPTSHHLYHHHHHLHHSNNNNDNKSSPSANLAIANGGFLSHSHSLDAIDSSTTTTATLMHHSGYNSRRPPDGKENDENKAEQNALSTSASAAGSLIVSSTTPDVQLQSSKEANGKINVQVTVLVENAYTGATLANLKKQRSQSRSTALNENGSVIGAANSEGATVAANNTTATTTTTTNQPIGSLTYPAQMEFSQLPSTTNTETSFSSIPPVTKFSGVTGDVVSDSTSSKKCCLLM